MMLQPQSQLVFVGFGYVIENGTRKSQAGKEEPIRILSLVDNPSGLAMKFIFSVDEFDQFLAKCGDNRIVAASQLPSKIIAAG